MRFVAALLLLTATFPVEATDVRHHIKVHAVPSSATAWIQEIVVNEAPSFAAQLATSKYAFWALVHHLQSNHRRNFCFAIVGLTYPDDNSRSVRIPGYRAQASIRDAKNGDLSDEELLTCVGSALKIALTTLAREPWERLAADADTNTSLKGTRRHRNADPNSYLLRYYGNGSINSIDAPDGFSQAFDSRELHLVVLSTSVKDETHFICLGISGAAVTPPDDRNSRFPWRFYTEVWNAPRATLPGVDDAAKLASCETEVAQYAVSRMFRDSWDRKGFLERIEWTREDGVPLVRSPKPIKERPSANINTRRAGTPQHRPISCQNRCVNGACVRTLGDGRQERWQAPRVFNPLKNEWEWQTDSCGN